MASQRDQQRVQFAPTPIAQDAAGFQIGQNWDQAAAALGQAGQQFQQLADGEARRSAELEAPEIIQRDGNQMLIAPSTFEPAGITTRAYRDKYRETAFAQYTHAAAMEFGNFVGETRTQHPTDPEALNTKLDEKKNAMLSGLDPSVAPFMNMRFNAMTGQAVSQTAMAKRTEQMKVLEADAATSLEIYQAAAAQVAGTAWKLEMTQEEVLANNSFYALRWKETKALLEGAGKTPEFIDKAFRETGVKIYIAGYAQQIRDTAINTGVHGVSAEGVQYLYNNIKTIADQAPPQYRAQVMQALESEAGRVIAAANRQQAVVDQKEMIADTDLQRKLELRRRTEATVGQMSGLGMMPGRDTSATLMAQFDREKFDVMMNPNISSQSAMRQIAMYDRAGATHMNNSNEFYAQRMVGLSAPLDDINASPAVKKDAIRQISGILSDPDLDSVLPVGVRAHGQRAVSTFVKAAAKENHDQIWAMGDDGALNPGQTRSYLASGTGGSFRSRAEMAKWEETSNDKYATRQQQGATAVAGLRGWGERNTPPTAVQQKAIGLEKPFITSDRKPFDVGNPDHIENASSYVNATGFVPEEVKASFLQAPLGGNMQQTMAVFGLYTKLAEVVASRSSPDKLSVDMGTMIGSSSALLMENIKSLGYDKAIARYQKEGDPGRAPGFNDKKLTEEIDAALDGRAGSMYSDAVDAQFSLFGADRNKTLALDIMKLSGQAPGLGDYVKGGLGSLPKLSINPALRAHVQERIQLELQTNGRFIDTVAGPLGENRVQYATRQTLANMKERLDVAQLPDGSMELTWTTANRKVGELLKIGRADEATTNAFIEASIASQRKNGKSVVDFDPGTVRATFAPNEQGDMVWTVAGARNGGVVRLGTFPENHPLFGGMGSKVSEKVAEKMLREYHGKSSPGTPPTSRELGWNAGFVNGMLWGDNAGGVGGFAQDVWTAVTTPLQGPVRRNMILEELATYTTDTDPLSGPQRFARDLFETEATKKKRLSGEKPIPPPPQALETAEQKAQRLRAADEAKKSRQLDPGTPEQKRKAIRDAINANRTSDE